MELASQQHAKLQWAPCTHSSLAFRHAVAGLPTKPCAYRRACWLAHDLLSFQSCNHGQGEKSGEDVGGVSNRLGLAFGVVIGAEGMQVSIYCILAELRSFLAWHDATCWKLRGLEYVYGSCLMTTVGATVIFFSKRANTALLAAMLGLSAGVIL
eukprot:1143797-Pelagomonas_calceolata.AAC.3